PPPRQRPRLAMFTPMPPLHTGVADYSFRLVQELARHCDVDVFVDGPPDRFSVPAVPGVTLLGAPTFRLVRALRDYTRGLYVMGNSHFHFYVRRALHECPGDVHAHDVRLVNLYQELRELKRSGDEVPALDAASDPYLFGEVARYAHRVFVHSEFARRAAAAQG